MKILHIDSSILGSNSASRKLSAETVAHLQAKHPGATVIYRDLVAEPVAYLTGEHLGAMQGGTTNEVIQRDLAHGNALVEELIAADVIVIGAPMYNFTIPAQLKSWIDRVLVAGKTFRYGASGPEGLLPANKKAILISARGGVYSAGTGGEARDHQEPLLTEALSFIGLTDTVWIRAEGLAMGAETRDAALAAAQREITLLTV